MHAHVYVFETERAKDKRLQLKMQQKLIRKYYEYVYANICENAK